MLVAYYGNRLRISKLSVALSFCVLCSSLQRILYMQGTYFYCFFKVFHLFFILIFRKSGFIRRHTIAQKDFERTCADYCISGEKGFASRLNNSLDWWDKAPFFCAYAKEVLLRGFDDFSFFVVLLSRKRKAVYDRTFHKWNKPSLTADKPGRMILSIRPNTFGQTDKNILPCRWFARFHATGYVLFCWGCLFHGFLFWSFPV